MTYCHSADPVGPYNPQPYPGLIPTPLRKASEQDLPEEERRGIHPGVAPTDAPPEPPTSDPPAP